MFGSRVGFSGSADRIVLFLVAISGVFQDGGRPPSWKILTGRICATGDLIHFMFGSRVGFSRSADWMALFPVTLNPLPQIRPLADIVHYKYIFTYLLTINIYIYKLAAGRHLG